jgi:hypothetical protein
MNYLTKLFGRYDVIYIIYVFSIYVFGIPPTPPQRHSTVPFPVATHLETERVLSGLRRVQGR